MPRFMLRFDHVAFSYESSLEPLLSGVSFSCAHGWTGIVGANGSGKTTLLRLALGEILPSEGCVLSPDWGVLCEQRTDVPPVDLSDLLASEDSDACAVRGRLQLEPSWLARWSSLSHGERKRAQLATALWRKPPLLALDEPTNHLDSHAKNLVLHALRAFDGIGLLVSHDRQLLDDLCRQCVFLDPPSAFVRPGGYSDGAEQGQRERDTVRRARRQADKLVQGIRQEANRRREQSLKNEGQKSARGIDKNDHDAKARIYLARVTDGGSGQRLRQLEGRLTQAEQRKTALRVQKEFALGVALPGVRAPRKHLASLAPMQLALGPTRTLSVPSLVVFPHDRIAIVGPNGSGKSTLLEHLRQATSLPKERVAYLPQEIDADDSRAALKRFRDLPHQQLGQAMTVVRRLGSSPQRLLDSEQPSPGEVRKLLLSSCIVTEPYLIILDEPTNHLDLPSIECLENALASCEAALVLVSHDQRFLQKLADTVWELRETGEGSELWVR